MCYPFQPQIREIFPELNISKKRGLMCAEEVVRLMRNSRGAGEWLSNLKFVKAQFGGRLPIYWQERIIESGIEESVLNQSRQEQRVAELRRDATKG